MKARTKKKGIMAATAGLALVTLFSGTFAWINLTESRINHMKGEAFDKDSVKINEVWENPEIFEPGKEYEKKVSITNSGSMPVYVRVSYEEALDSYKNKANQTTTNAGYDGKAGVYPVNAKADAFKEWTAVKAENITGTLPTNLEVKVKGAISNGKASYDIAGIYNYGTKEAPKYQKVKIKKSALTTQPTAETAVADWKFTIDPAQVDYYYYEGLDQTGKDWAGSNMILGQNPVTVLKEDDHDFSMYANTPITPQTAVKGPHLDATSGRWESSMLADATLGENFKTFYNKDGMVTATDMAALTGTATDKWVYNEGDGYFYYLDVLTGGKTTTDFLNSIKLDDSAGAQAMVAYSDLHYDLIVNMEVVQATVPALSDAVTADAQGNNNGGWGMDLTNPGTKAIYDHLAKLAPQMS